LGLLADRLSVNIELPSQEGLQMLAPDKTKKAILQPMRQIRDEVLQSKTELTKYKHAPVFAPAGQSTQLIVGATKDSDRHILHLTQSLYDQYQLKRVFYSAYVPVVEHSLLPSLDTKPPLLREHRLYQADWLLRFYGFRAEELLNDDQPDFNPLIDPKCSWAIGHLEQFPVEIMRADYETLLRVPGIGPTSARRIISARRSALSPAEVTVFSRAELAAFLPCRLISYLLSPRRPVSLLFSLCRFIRDFFDSYGRSFTENRAYQVSATEENPTEWEQKFQLSGNFPVGLSRPEDRSH
jgi:predicted DNA-binding helix-hairpin-helix protein